MLMFGRRGIDVSQRKDFVAVSETMATVMHNHLKEFSFSKYFRMSEKCFVKIFFKPMD